MKTTLVALTSLLMAFFSITRSQAADLPTFSIVSGQVTEAAVIITADGPRLRVNLTAEKGIELADLTQQNIDKKIKIVVADKLVSEPVVKQRIVGGTTEFIVASAEEGLSLAKTLMTK